MTTPGPALVFHLMAAFDADAVLCVQCHQFVGSQIDNSLLERRKLLVKSVVKRSDVVSHR